MASVEEFGGGKSLARRYVDPPSEWLMAQIHHVPVLDKIGPDEITIGGTVLRVVGALIQEQAHVENRNLSAAEKRLLIVLKGVGYYADKADGSMANVFDAEEPGRHDRFKGQKIDAEWDRREEASAAFLRARTAYYKDSLFGEVAAYAAALTCVLPSIERARIETLGFNPPETGRFWESLGTRSRRAVFTEVALLRTIGGIYVQPWVDITASLANLNTARVRNGIYEKYKNVDPSHMEKDEEKRNQTSKFAYARLAGMESVQREIILGVAGTFIGLRSGVL